jgi:NAD(P)-dependent dehydrogenase (short-subunit alcohol dehydrogenase family)
LPRMTSYAASKAAVVRFTESLAHDLKPHGIDVNAIAPGALNTRLLDEVLVAGPEAVGEGFYERMVKVKREGGTPLSCGAELAVYLASDASNGITGRLISATWDKWSTLHERALELDATDVYTLRRIVPADRGLNWDE